MLSVLRSIKYANVRLYSTAKPELLTTVNINGHDYPKDDYTNVTPKILSHLNKNLHTKPQHPLSLVRQRIVNYFYKTYKNPRGNPIFSVYDNLSPVVTVEQNFDSLLIPDEHPSRAKTDCYYANQNVLLRAHTTAHQRELMRAGLDNFLIIGDVYRRDEIDRTHYPVFHQVDAVKLHTRDQLFPKDKILQLFEVGYNTEGGKQPYHTLEAVKVLEHQLKTCLTGLAKELFGLDIEYRWVDTEFPFTCPSWELEVKFRDDWLELLGCGIMRQPIITEAGVTDRVGWAFGIGLERVAMILYQIPDIRLFWSEDTGFLSQFKNAQPETSVTYKPISQYPQCTNDISFWIPNDIYNSNDFYDLVRTIGGDLIEQVTLFDNFTHPKHKKTSHSYRIVYRHMERTLTQAEVNKVHGLIADSAVKALGVTIR